MSFSPNVVPGENGFVLCVSDGFSSIQAFIQTKQNPAHTMLSEIQTLCIVRLMKPSVRIMHGARVLYCTGVRTVHMPVPLIGNPCGLHQRDKIQFVRPVFSHLGLSLNGDEALHRIVDYVPFQDNDFQDFFIREQLDIDRLQAIDFLLHNKSALISSANNPSAKDNIHCFKKRDHELLSLFEEKLSGFELEYWLIKQYLQSVVLCWKVQGKLYVYRYENVLHKFNITVGSVEASIGGVPMFELRDEDYTALRESLKKLNLNFVVLYTNHRFFEYMKPSNFTPLPLDVAKFPSTNSWARSLIIPSSASASDVTAFTNTVSPPSSGSSELNASNASFTPTTPTADKMHQYSWWTVEQSKHIPLSAFLDYLPIALIRSICQPLPQIFDFREECKSKLNMIHNLLDFVFFFGKQLFFIHILKSVSCMDELMDLLFPFIDRCKVQGSRRLLGLFRQFLLLNRFDTERFFSNLPTPSVSRLLQIFYLDQVLPQDAKLRHVVNILFDEIDLLGMQSHLRRLNPKLLQFIAVQVGVKNRALLDEDLILYILGLCFPFVVQSNGGSTARGGTLSVYPAVNSGSDSADAFVDYETPSLDPVSLVELEKELHSHISEQTLLREAAQASVGVMEPASSNRTSEMGQMDSTCDDEKSKVHSMEGFLYNTYPDGDLGDVVVGIIIQTLGDEGYIFCLSHGGSASHYIMFSELHSSNDVATHDEHQIGDLVSFRLQHVGDCIRAQSIRVLASLSLSDEVLGNKKTIQQLMYAYTQYYCSSKHILNAKLTLISPVAISNSFSPYFAQQRNPAQIIGLLMRDTYSMPVKIADTLSSFADKEYCGVITRVEHTRGEIIEQHTWEKIIFYFDPNDRPIVGTVALCCIVHIGFVAFATSVQIVPRHSPHFTVDHESLLKSTFFLQNELHQLEQENLKKRRKLELRHTQSKVLALEHESRTTNKVDSCDNEDEIEGGTWLGERALNGPEAKMEAFRNDEASVRVCDVDSPSLQYAAKHQYSTEELLHIRDSMLSDEDKMCNFYMSMCKEGVASNLWDDNIDYSEFESDSDEDDCVIELNLNSEWIRSEGGG